MMMTIYKGYFNIFSSSIPTFVSQSVHPSWLWFYFHTFTFHTLTFTFTFTLLLPYFCFHTFILFFSHFHFCTFTFTLIFHFSFHTFTFLLSLGPVEWCRPVEDRDELASYCLTVEGMIDFQQSFLFMNTVYMMQLLITYHNY